MGEALKYTKRLHTQQPLISQMTRPYCFSNVIISNATCVISFSGWCAQNMSATDILVCRGPFGQTGMSVLPDYEYIKWNLAYIIFTLKGYKKTLNDSRSILLREMCVLKRDASPIILDFDSQSCVGVICLKSMWKWYESWISHPASKLFNAYNFGSASGQIIILPFAPESLYCIYYF
jgi:hypothetical protein